MNNRDALLTHSESHLFFFRISTLGSLFGWPSDKQRADWSAEQLLMTCVSMVNPHAVFFCDNAALIDLAEFGAAVEHHSLFPRRTNVHFVQIDRPAEFTIRTWERGSGVCACCVAAVLTGRQGRLCTAHLPGGDLELNWRQDDNCVHTTGPATEVFEGTWPED